MEWHEIRNRAINFVKEWQHETRERAESQTFWNDFFNIFGVRRRRVGTFEQHVKKLRGATKSGFVDLLWPGVLLAEHKSKGKSLQAACEQATDYFDGLTDAQLPCFVIISDFARIRLLNIETQQEWVFPIEELPDKIQLFYFILGRKQKTFAETSPVTNKAGEMLGSLHDMLKSSGYNAKALEVYLVRLLFCLFADDTGIFERKSFAEYVRGSREDGGDLGGMLAAWFEVLDVPQGTRSKNLGELLQAIPYVNGKLFQQKLPIAAFDGEMRDALLKCSELNWGAVCPSVFGNLFQSIMAPAERRQQGTHYTDEKNIKKIIEPLFLDELRAEFELSKRNSPRLSALHKKITSLRFLDPACGCGNFLVVAYRELRQLEIDIIKAKYKGAIPMDVFEDIKVNVDQFYGIEMDDFAVQVAKVALWLTDHQMNNIVSKEFGAQYLRLPLVTAPYIVRGNALRLDWEGLLHPLKDRGGLERFNYILGNPPYVGSCVMADEQKEDMRAVFEGSSGAGLLDYVCAWYKKAANYTRVNPNVKCAFVSTNSITQGEQPAYLWQELLKDGIGIHFAHRTFKWYNEGRNNAAVHVVIVGFGKACDGKKRLYSYADINGDPEEEIVDSITPYLTEGETILVMPSEIPLCNTPKMLFGSMPRDGGHLVLSDEEREEILAKHPSADRYIRPYLGAREFINGESRWCLWLVDIEPDELKKLPAIAARVKAVREFRSRSKAASTQRFADTPALFCQIAQPDTDYLMVPRSSSEQRSYIPMGFMPKTAIASDAVMTVADASLYTFGVMSSAMHMAWMRVLAGRLKSDYRYSATMVYNNFPWPAKALVVKKKNAARRKVEEAAQAVLNARKNHSQASLADLYDDATMPPDLRKAHQVLDKAVDACYGKTFNGEKGRVEFLLGLYRDLAAKE